MNEIQIFDNPEFGSIRTLTINEEPYFVGKDVAEILKYENPTKAVRDHVDAEDKRMGVQNGTPYIIDSMGRKQYPTFINESGLYSLIIGSKLPTAKKFKRWVTSEVLPSIRKHGAYATEVTIDRMVQDPDFAIELLTQLKEERKQKKLLEARNAEMQPKALFADAVTASHTSILVGDLAKILKQNGIEIGQRRLFEWMRDQGYLIKRKGSDWNSPTQKSMEKGLMEIKESTIQHGDGHVSISKTTKITGKGQVYFVNKFLKEAE